MPATATETGRRLGTITGSYGWVGSLIGSNTLPLLGRKGTNPYVLQVRALTYGPGLATASRDSVSRLRRRRRRRRRRHRVLRDRWRRRRRVTTTPGEVGRRDPDLLLLAEEVVRGRQGQQDEGPYQRQQRDRAQRETAG